MNREPGFVNELCAIAGILVVCIVSATSIAGVLVILYGLLRIILK
jgi:hypothetical protein